MLLVCAKIIFFSKKIFTFGAKSFTEGRKKLIVFTPCLKDYYYICGINIRNGIYKWISLIYRVDECVNKGLPEPEFDDSCGFVTVTFRYNNHISATQAPHKHHISTTQVTELVKVFGNETLSVKDLMERLKINNRSYFTKEYLQPAVNEGFIVPIYPNQPRSPKQKYYLTDKGKELLQNCN